MKKFKDIIVGDILYFFTITENKAYEVSEKIKTNEILADCLKTDLVIDKFNQNKLKLQKRGILQIDDVDLYFGNIICDVSLLVGSPIVFITTSKKELKKVIKKMFDGITVNSNNEIFVKKSNI